MKFDVTFYFKTCNVTVSVYAENEAKAIQQAREQYYPYVPSSVPTKCVYSGTGGKREGSGAKKGSTLTSEPRNIKKQLRHTEKEWAFIESECEESGLDIATYQREILSLGIITMKDRRYQQ